MGVVGAYDPEADDMRKEYEDEKRREQVGDLEGKPFESEQFTNGIVKEIAERTYEAQASVESEDPEDGYDEDGIRVVGVNDWIMLGEIVLGIVYRDGELCVQVKRPDPVGDEGPVESEVCKLEEMISSMEARLEEAGEMIEAQTRDLTDTLNRAAYLRGRLDEKLEGVVAWKKWLDKQRGELK